MKKKITKAMLRAKYQEAVDLQAWYESDEYGCAKLQSEIISLEKSIETLKKDISFDYKNFQ